MKIVHALSCGEAFIFLRIGCVHRFARLKHTVDDRLADTITIRPKMFRRKIVRLPHGDLTLFQDNDKAAFGIYQADGIQHDHVENLVQIQRGIYSLRNV